MAHKRKDTFTAPPEWWKHLRPFNKRRVAKKERDAAKHQIVSETGQGPVMSGARNQTLGARAED